MKRIFALLLVALYAGAAHASRPPIQTVLAIPAPVKNIPVYVQNHCAYPIKLLVAGETNGTMQVNGWFTIPGNTKYMPLGEGADALRANPAIGIYYYAYLPETKHASPPGLYTATYRGKTYAMAAAQSELDNLGNMVFAIGCFTEPVKTSDLA